jgi:tetratricopeptide (TPR) repeat protein
MQQYPTSIDLNSELLLERPSFAKSIASFDNDKIPAKLQKLDPNSQPALQDVDTAIILLKIASIRAVTPHKDPLVGEELLAMANRIINSPESTTNWGLFSRALWIRSVLESDSAKTVERGTLQIQSLVEELGQANAASYIPKSSGSANNDETSKNQADRLAFIHQLMPLPKWAMDITLAETFMALGALKSAIEVYERLEMWGEVALCYAAVGQESEGEKVLLAHLDKDPSDYRSWSILGNIKLDPNLWQKAWDMGRYAPAKLSLGRFYHNPPRGSGYERNIEVAIVHLAEALKVNPLNQEAWFLYGVCGLESEQWELAAEAFTRCVAMDETDAKSWSNLASALLRQGKKKEAFNALKQAVRAGSEQGNWRIWSNYTTVALDLGNWPEVLIGTKQLIMLRKEKDGEAALDVPILEALCQVLVNQEYKAEASSRPDYFQRSCADLFVNVIPSLVTTDAHLWQLVAKVHMWQKKPWAALDDYERGFRIYAHLPQVELEEKYWNEAVDFCQDLVDAYSNLGPLPGRHGEGSLVCKDWAYKARSTVRLLMGRGKRAWEDTPGWNRLVEMKQDL